VVQRQSSVQPGPQWNLARREALRGDVPGREEQGWVDDRWSGHRGIRHRL